MGRSSATVRIDATSDWARTWPPKTRPSGVHSLELDFEWRPRRVDCDKGQSAIDLAPGNLAYKNNLGKILAKEESAIHKLPIKKSKKDKKDDDDRVIVKKLRPKLF